MAEEPEIDLGTPGGSAKREHERRRTRREAKTRENHPHIGNFLLRVQSAPTSETVWETGAVGEEMLAVHLAKTCPEVIVLHDRRIPGRRTNIDHLAVAPSGVFVIDAKRYKGKIEVRHPFLGDPHLFIAGRNKGKLVDGLLRQRDAVRSALADTNPELPVHACFCFLNPRGQAGGSGLPLFRTLSINGLQLFYPRKLSKRLNAPGAFTCESRHGVAAVLARAFPPAAG
jgi:nuclease-like protein